MNQNNKKEIFSITGMHCASCAKIIEIKAQELPGVNKVKVDFSAEKADVLFDSNRVSEKDIIDSIENAGYKAKINL